MTGSLFWYDIETFGRHTQLDRLACLAGIRTDDNFEPMADPLVEYVRPAPDYVPDPKACFVTGITPKDTLEKGISEYELAVKINNEWSKPGTCVVGYNNIQFDDEFMRTVFYRNLIDPYEREWARGNSRWDLINVMRAARDLRPQGIEWPNQDDGKPCFKLEILTAANNIAHEQAHDALSDVYATIGLAKLLYQAQPKLFQFLYKNRTKGQVSQLINLQNRTPVLFTSSVFSRLEGSTSVVAPLTVDPANRNSIIAFDLRCDPRPLLELSVEQVHQRVFTRKNELKEIFNEDRIPLLGIPINKCPVLAPLKTMDQAAACRLQIDKDQIHKHWQLLQKEANLTEKVRAVFDHHLSTHDDKASAKRGAASPSSAASSSIDVDVDIYSGGFFPDRDRERFLQFHQVFQAMPKEASLLQPPDIEEQDWRIPAEEFQDHRAYKLLYRLIGRNYPALLGPKEQKQWKNFCATRLLFPPGNEIDDFGTFEKKLANLSRDMELPAQHKVIVRKLLDYCTYLKETVLAYQH